MSGEIETVFGVPAHVAARRIRACSGLDLPADVPGGAIKRLVEAAQIAYREFNAIRARDGSPQHIDWRRGVAMQVHSVAPEAWDQWTEQISAALAALGVKEEQ